MTTHGRSSGYCVDPIEKKPLNHFLPGTPVLSFDMAGCILECNDAVIFLEHAVDAAAACPAAGAKTVAVAAGYICPEPREEFLRHVDAANIDLKAFTEEFYRKICCAELTPVLETLEYLKHETGVWFELTTLLIPGENDPPAELDHMTRWFVDKLGPDVSMHFSAFHPDWKMRDHRPPPGTRFFRRARSQRRTGCATPM